MNEWQEREKKKHLRRSGKELGRKTLIEVMTRVGGGGRRRKKARGKDGRQLEGRERNRIEGEGGGLK